MKKRILSTFLSISFIISLLAFPSTQKVYAASNTIKVGDYVQFGEYLDKPILWKVINIDSDGSPMLFSDKIISLKPFDAAESGTNAKQLDNPYSSDQYRQTMGSNRWKNSNIRDWLNSNDYVVKYSTQAPTKEASNYNSYDKEPGFLTNFTKDELRSIKPVNHKSILASIDKSEKAGGTEAHFYNENLANCLEHYDSAYYENVTDKVYLLDVKEFYDYIYKRGFDFIKKPTEEAVVNSEYKDNILSANNYWFYWLRTPCADFTGYTRHMEPDHFMCSSSCNLGSGGIAPVLNLNTVNVKSGSGTANDPFIPANGSSIDDLYSDAFSSVNNAQSSKTQRSVNTARTLIDALKNTDAAWAIGEFSKQVDQIQHPILLKAVNAITKAKSTGRQADINTARAAIDPDLPSVWKYPYSSAVDEIQQKLMISANDAVQKAIQSKSQQDINDAVKLLDEIKTAVDSSISAWAETMKKQLYSPSTPPVNKTSMQIGDYVQFGKYLGSPILWRVINIDNNGLPMLLSEKILCLKPFDAAESGRDGETGNNPYSTVSYRQAYGSNRWENSNIREWLNSSDSTVKYSTQAPTKEAVYENSYASEPGFLTNFTAGELNNIKPITHKAILTTTDSASKDGGTVQSHTFNENPGDWTQNYDDVYYENVTDSVYLLDVKELDDYVYKRGFDFVKKPTAEAVNNSQHKYTVLDPNNYWFYWLRVPCTDDPGSVRHMDSPGFAFSSNASWYSGGIVPALNLKTALFKSGNGTIDSPYIPDDGNSSDKLYSEAYNCVQAAQRERTQKSINAARAAIAALKGTEASFAIDEFSRIIDAIQQPILDKANAAIKTAQDSVKQVDINNALGAIDPDLPNELKSPMLSAVSIVQEKLKSKAVSAHNKAVQTKAQADIDYANALIAELETASDPAVVAFAKDLKNQTGIVNEVVSIKDKNLEQAIRCTINKPSGDLYKTDLEKITYLTARGKSITDLSGIEYMTQLQYLDLGTDASSNTYNYISDLSPLRSLTNLTDLILAHNSISDLSPLSGLYNLKYLELYNNNISNLKPLAGLNKLDRLLLNFNKVTDITVVKDLPGLTVLFLEGNPISDISVMKTLPNLSRFTNLNFWNTNVRDSDVIELKQLLPHCSFYNQ